MGGFVVRFVRGLSVKTTQFLGFVGIATLCGLLAAALAIPLVGALAYATNTGAREVTQFPSDLKIPSLDGRTYVYDRTGGLIATFFTKNRVYVPLAKIAPVMQKAMVDIEDERFYQHGAADLRGTLRALVANSTSSTTQGGSTLTQQYVKNILIDSATTPAQLAPLLLDRTVTEKIRELRYSIALEEKLSKKQILEGYLNIAPFGQSVYGIEAASEYYFNTTAAKLTIPQAAMLAGEVQAPSQLDPTAAGSGHVVLATTRRNVVLQKMWSLHHITTAERNAALKSPLGIHKTAPKQSCAAAAVSQWYCQYVYNVLLRDPQLSTLGKTSSERETRILSGGLKIYTALDPKIQKLADGGMAAATNPGDTPIAATAIVKPGTGDVLAVSTSKDFGYNTKDKGQTQYDWAIPTLYGSTPGFQPGSGMKPITMAVALKAGVMFNTRFVAKSGLSFAAFPFYDCAGDAVSNNPSDLFGNEGGENYGSIGMLQALWESVNSYFIQLESKVGLCAVYKQATAMGLTSAQFSSAGYVPAPLNQNATLTIGGSNTSPLQMSEVYATFANHGVYCAPRVVTKIVAVDSNKVLYDQAPQCTRVMPADVADAISWVLYHNVQGDLDPRSTAHPAIVYGTDGQVIPTGGKTGTNNSFQAVWYNGFNSQFASSMAVAMPTTVDKYGNDTTLRGQLLGGSTIVDATGGKTAGRVWLAVMTPVLEAQTTHPGFPGTPADKFEAPGALTGVKATVPDVVGSSVTTAEATLAQAQFSYTVDPTPIDSTVAAGDVAKTDPAGGSQADLGSSVTIYTSTGNSPSPSSTPSSSGSPSSSPTSSPTNPPPVSSTPTSGPTSRPTSRPTSGPTSTSTSKPTSKPTKTRKPRKSATAATSATTAAVSSLSSPVGGQAPAGQGTGGSGTGGSGTGGSVASGLPGREPARFDPPAS